jgi:hypothetical protein
MTGSNTSTYGPYRRYLAIQADEWEDVLYSHHGLYSGSTTVVITNTGGGTLTVSDVTSTAEGHWMDNTYMDYNDSTDRTAWSEGCTAGLAAGQSCTLTLKTQYDAGEYNNTSTNYSLKQGTVLNYTISTNGGNLGVTVTVN